MTKRIVKMTFDPGKIESFKAIFEVNGHLIRGFDGCEHVELLQDKLDPRIFFTFSIWTSDEHLDAYRKSDLFNTVWSATKVLFCEKPQAWSVKELRFE